VKVAEQVRVAPARPKKEIRHHAPHRKGSQVARERGHGSDADLEAELVGDERRKRDDLPLVNTDLEHVDGTKSDAERRKQQVPEIMKRTLAVTELVPLDPVAMRLEPGNRIGQARECCEHMLVHGSRVLIHGAPIIEVERCITQLSACAEGHVGLNRSSEPAERNRGRGILVGLPCSRLPCSKS
jgi:hypothetical protein